MSKEILLILFFFLAFVGIRVTTASAEGNNCFDKEIYVSNQVAVSLWYKRDGGQCSLLNKHNVLIVHPGEVFQIYSDSNCKSDYCSSFIHEGLISSDQDGRLSRESPYRLYHIRYVKGVRYGIETVI